MLIAYEDKKPTTRTLAMIDRANDIIAEYEAKGFSLTLRQLYYQFVARDLIPNTVRSYKILGSAVNTGRMCGLISWESIEDRTRNLKSLPHWDSPNDIMQSVISSYRIDKWANQKCRPEVWIEKEALLGVISGVCNSLDVPYFACRGYNSQSEQWRAGRRFRRYYTQFDKLPMVFHLGDHDPSGIDMTRDNDERLQLFSGVPVIVKRLALNYGQIEQYDPPPNPAKVSDSRYSAYATQYGKESWELDALEPEVIVDLIRQAIIGIRDEDALQRTLRKERQDINELKKAAKAMRGGD